MENSYDSRFASGNDRFNEEGKLGFVPPFRATPTPKAGPRSVNYVPGLTCQPCARPGQSAAADA